MPAKITGRPVILLGAGILHRIGPSRVSVHLARALAEQGHWVLRFDLSGIGDSDRAAGEGLVAAVVADLTDAIDLATDPSRTPSPGLGVSLVGYCSGADNAYYVAADDPRVHAAVLFDPMVHQTEGFRRREWIRRLTSARSWFNVISGRSVFVRVRARVSGGAYVKPPDYYGLLVAGAEDADARAVRLRARGVRLLYLLSAGCHGYCNSPEQVREALPRGFSPELFTTIWAPDVDHVFSRARQIYWLIKTVGEFLA